MESIIHLIRNVKEIIRGRIGLEFGAPPAKAGKQELRCRNTLLLLALIQSDGPSSQADLARRSALSPATVSGILQPLIESRILIEEGKSTAGLGRRASILAFNPRANITAGVSIDLEEVEVALVDLSGRVLDQTSSPYPRYTEPNEVVTLAAECLSKLEVRNAIGRDAVAGIGVAIPGLISASTGLVQVASNLGWMNVQLRDLFEQRLGAPVRVEHLGRAKARAEAIWGKGKNHRNFICLEIGSGIGAGIVVHGRILRGAGGIGGEVGHMPVDLAGPVCACGLKGCWEVFCSGPAIRRNLARRLAERGDFQSVLSPLSSLKDLDAAYRKGDPVAIEVIEESAAYLVRGLTGVIWSFDPEFVLLTGPVVTLCPSLFEAAQLRMIALKGTARSFDVPLILESHPAGTGVVAAAATVATRYLEELASNGRSDKMRLAVAQ